MDPGPAYLGAAGAPFVPLGAMFEDIARPRALRHRRRWRQPNAGTHGGLGGILGALGDVPNDFMGDMARQNSQQGQQPQQSTFDFASSQPMQQQQQQPMLPDELPPFSQARAGAAASALRSRLRHLTWAAWVCSRPANSTGPMPAMPPCRPGCSLSRSWRRSRWRTTPPKGRTLRGSSSSSSLCRRRRRSSSSSRAPTSWRCSAATGTRSGCPPRRQQARWQCRPCLRCRVARARSQARGVADGRSNIIVGPGGPLSGSHVWPAAAAAGGGAAGASGSGARR